MATSFNTGMMIETTCGTEQPASSASSGDGTVYDIGIGKILRQAEGGHECARVSCDALLRRCQLVAQAVELSHGIDVIPDGQQTNAQSHLGRQPASAGEEFQIAAAGPATSLLIAVVTGAAGFALRDVNDKLEAMLLYLAFVNTALAIFNILPGFPLDGGRVLRSIAWKRTGSFRRATRIASNVGELFGYGLIAIGFFLLLGGLIFNGLWLMFIGWFLLGAARSESANLQLEGVLKKLTARDVMRADFPSITPGAPLQAVVDDYMVGQGERAVMVANGGTVLGILTVSDVRRVPREEWPNTPAQSAMTPRERIVTVVALTPAVEVLVLLGEKRLNQVPVLDDGRMVGLVTRREILERLQLAETLNPDAGAAEESTAAT